MEALTLPLLAVVAGFVSFASPCCLPLVPGYLSYVSALPVSEVGDRDVALALGFSRVSGRWPGCGATAADSR